MSFSISILERYKHDIPGKFKVLTSAIETITEKTIASFDSHMTFHAVHEVLLKMVCTSRNTMLNNLSQEMNLIISKAEVDTAIPLLEIDGLAIRCRYSKDTVEYYYFINENEGDQKINVIKAHVVLPIKNVIFED